MEIVFLILSTIVWPVLPTTVIYFLIRSKYPNAARIYLKFTFICYLIAILTTIFVVDEKIGAVCIGIVSIICGVRIMLNPASGDLGTLNDAFLKRLYGQKGYVIIMRFVSGPICILLGLGLFWTAIN